MRQIKLILPVLVLLMLVGCAATTISPVDRSLIFIDKYSALEQTYKNQYQVASEMEREWLSENVAPLLDSMRVAVKQYTRMALIGHDDIEGRAEIMQFYRKAILEMTREVME